MTNRLHRATRFLTALALVPVLVIPLVGSDTGTDRRVLALQGTANTRDIGGYETDAGRRLRWRQVLRSDNLAHLTGDDVRTLESLGLKTIIDLRTTIERRQNPTVWPGGQRPEIVELPIGDEDGQWMDRLNRMLATGNFSGSRAMQHMVDAYRRAAPVAAGQFREVLTLVADADRRPLLIHCTSGKDRTGLAVALILEAVDVPRDVIRDDYLLTNETARVEERLRSVARSYANSRPQTGLRSQRGAPRAADFLPLIGVAPEMLDAFYAGIDAEYGSMDAYLSALGLDAAAREALRAALTE